LWIPKWLGEVYTKLYLEFDSDAEEALEEGLNPYALRVISKSSMYGNETFALSSE